MEDLDTDKNSVHSSILHALTLLHKVVYHHAVYMTHVVIDVLETMV